MVHSLKPTTSKYMSEIDDKKGWKVEKGWLKSSTITSMFSTK